MGMGRTTWKVRKAVKQLVLAACRSVSLLHPPVTSSRGSTAIIKQQEKCSLPHHHDKSDSTTQPILCAICLEPLSQCDEHHLFTGHCSHTFHFSCIAANVRHGSVSCPVCRAQWTHHLPCVFRYDDDDPISPSHSTAYPPRLTFSLFPAPSLVSYPCCYQVSYYPPLHMCNRDPFSPSMQEDCHGLCKRNAYLSLKLTNLQPIDLVLVVTSSEPHSQLLKQAMVLVTFSLRPLDRLAVVTHSARVFALRRMTSSGKRAVLRVIDRLFYMGQRTESSQGILKGIKVLRDRAYTNPRCSILHISTSLTRPHSMMQMGVMVHRFNVGYGNGFLMEEFLEKKVLGGGGGGVAIRDIQLRISMGMEMKIVRIGELRGGEERPVLLHLLGVYPNLGLCYSYVEGDTTADECCIRRRGETTLSLIGINTLEAPGGRDYDYYSNKFSVRRKHRY